MQIGVVYSEPGQQFWLNIELPEGATVADAIERSGVRSAFPQLDLALHKVGIFGRLVRPDAPLQAGDRVEIYRPIVADPATVPRRDLADDA